MNYSVLPDLLAIGGLVVVFVLLLWRADQKRLRFWAFGWILILVHFIAELPPRSTGAFTNVADAVAVSALLLSSVAFVWAGEFLPTAKGRGRLTGLAAAIPDVALCTAFACGSTSVPLFAALTVIGAAVSLPLYCRARREGDIAQRYLPAAFLVIAYGAQLVLIASGRIVPAFIWLLCWHFLAAAIAFRLGSARTTVGVIFTTISFVAWALVFPVAWAVGNWLPDAHVAAGVWNLPKYLVATGLLVTLLEEQMLKFEHASLHDALTGIPNRRMLLGALDRAAYHAARGEPFTLMILDLDLFKEINDRLGHVFGDKLLEKVARRLRGVLRQNDVLARIGGDEFAVLLTGISDRAAVKAVVEKIDAALDRPFVIEEHEYQVGVSAGYALSPGEGVDTAALYALADQRMYEAKQSGRKVPRSADAAGG
ncbi:MAG TPA: GGDEF domain-containing protein [Gammaproteobacteria bacterium]|nr:GGDEF domain-containing protein [Gammaproteobacteria bacterium]